MMKNLAYLFLFATSSLFARQTDSVKGIRKDSIQINHVARAKEYYDDFQFAKAAEEFKKQWLLDTANIKALNMLAICNVKLGKLVEAKSHYQTILKYD